MLETRLHVMWLLLSRKSDQRYVKLLQAYTELPEKKKKKRWDMKTLNVSHWLLSDRLWMSECVYRFVRLLSYVCDFDLMWLCVFICLRSTEKWCDCTDMCPAVVLAPGPFAHTPLVWVPGAPCIMKQARDSTLHDNVHGFGCCVYVCCTQWQEERACWHCCLQ